MRALHGLTLVVRVYAVGLWLFGLVVLGAIVAPIQFRVVPAPFAAEAMTTIFRRFDTIGLACAAVVWMTEVFLGDRAGPRLVVAKRSLAALATLALIVESFVVAPRIEELFRGGAVRGIGPDGETLSAWHRAAEGGGKLQVLTLALLLALELYELMRSRSGAEPEPPAAPSPPAKAAASSSSSAEATTRDEPR